MLEKEYVALREELRNLKSCQITFLNISITSTGLLIGLSKLIDVSSEYNIIFLVPLIIVIPSWFIFFDKATTITRIVGYFRILEKFLKMESGFNEKDVKKKYLGWENSLAKYRIWKYENTKRRFTAHKYWLLTWATFFLLGLISISLTVIYHLKFERWPISLNQSNLEVVFSLITLISIAIFIIAVSHTLYILKNLIKGHYSFDYNEKRWTSILGIK